MRELHVSAVKTVVSWAAVIAAVLVVCALLHWMPYDRPSPTALFFIGILLGSVIGFLGTRAS